MGIYANTVDGRIFVPNIQLRHLSKDNEMIPLRGYAHVHAVKQSDGKVIGWIMKGDGEKCREGFCNPRHS